MNTLSSNGEALIKGFEALRLTAYQDGGGVWSAGWGHTGSDVVEGTRCTYQQAQDWFETDAFVVERAVDSALLVHLNQPQFDALCSIAYNIGPERFQKSTLLKLVNQRDFGGAAAQFLVWDEINGQYSQGLENRRIAEQTMFEGRTPQQEAPEVDPIMDPDEADP